VEQARVDLLQRMPIFGGIRADTLDLLISQCPIVEVRAGELFFREGEAADSMFVLEAGKVAVVKSWGSAEQLLHTLDRGDCFGEMALMDLMPRCASVRALEDCRAIRISAASLYEVYEKDLEQFAIIQMNMGREVSRRLREADECLFRAQMGAPGTGASGVFRGG
jgi:CRP-like cAMP-binding protein